MYKIKFSKPSSTTSQPQASSSTVPRNDAEKPISEPQTTSDGVDPAHLDGADPTLSSPYNEFEFIHTDSANDNLNSPNRAGGGDGPAATSEPGVIITFNPLTYNLPTRFHKPLSTPIGTPNSTAASADGVFLADNPTPHQIRLFLDDIEQAGKDYGMSGGETIGMALYYADRNSRLLWKWMVESAKGQDWARFKNHVMWFYPDAILEQDEVQRVFMRVRISLANEEIRTPVGAYNVSPSGARKHIIGCLRILEDFSTRMGSSNRQLCIGFAAGLPPRKLGKQNSDLWNEALGNRVRERYPELSDEFDCNPRRFLYYAFLVWREAWVLAEYKYFKDSGFYS